MPDFFGTMRIERPDNGNHSSSREEFNITPETEENLENEEVDMETGEILTTED